MADSQRKSYNLFDKSQISSITTPIGDRYGSIFESGVGTYTIDITGVTNSGDYLYADKVLSDGTSGARYYIVNNGTKTTTQLTISNEGEKFLIYNASGDNLSASQTKFDRWLIMLNSGSTAKPYEPYGWVHSLRKLTTATEAVENPLYSDGTDITNYTIKGNTVQSGTPTPSNPVDVNGVGVRTENLINVTLANALFYTDYPASTYNHFTIQNGVITFENSQAALFYILTKVEQNTEYYYRISTSDVVSVRIRNYSDVPSTRSANWISTSFNSQINGNFSRSYTTPENTQYVAIEFYHDPSESEKTAFNIMVSESETAYEPYGFKIPILTAQGSAVNYLGSVSSNRQIYKLVLDGTENYGKDSGGTYLYYKAVNPTHAKIEQCLCTHLPNASDYPRDSIGIYATKWANNAIYFNFGAAVMDVQPSGNTVTGLKEYLAAQYAAGTPVTIWYILETSTTGTVNEPLMKIGTYADSISNAVAIPTADGANSITVDTTVQPSEFTATWTGWHDSSVKEYDGSDWQ